MTRKRVTDEWMPHHDRGRKQGRMDRETWTGGAEGFRRGRNLDGSGCHALNTSGLFFDNVEIPPGNILGQEEGKGICRMMQQLPQERPIIGSDAPGAREGTVERTIRHCKERGASGGPLTRFQNTRFKLAECQTRTTVARSFLDACIAEHLRGALRVEKAAMAKYGPRDTEGEVLDECLRLHGGYGYTQEDAAAEMWTDARLQRIYGDTNDIMKERVARALCWIQRHRPRRPREPPAGVFQAR